MMQFVLENFDTIFRNRESLDNLEKMMLDLAVRGKLVPQNPQDEPARELLKKIKAEKERLIGEKVIKKEKPLPPIAEEEIPFEIPESWEWVRLGEINKRITDGTHQTPTYSECGRPFISAKNVKPYKFNFENYKYISEELFSELTKEIIPEREDILMTRVGAGIGEATIINVDTPFAIYVSVALLKIFKKHINNLYVLDFINSSEGQKKLKGAIYGIGHSQGNLNLNKIRELLIPLPPFEEQLRISEKIEKIRKIIEELKKIYSANETNRLNLKKSILAEIETSSSNRDLLDALELVFNNFNSVIRTKDDVKDIRNLVLSLAVKGKLVPQNPEDEPASELLKKIKSEKERLVAEKIIKKEKSLPPIEEEEIPFEIPENWEWVRLGEVTELKKGKKPNDLTEKPGKYVYVDVGAFDRGIINQYSNSENCPICNKDDLLIICDGSRSGYIGYAIEGIVGSTLAKINIFSVEKRYLNLLLKSNFKRFNESMRGARIPHLDTGKFRKLLIGLPPLQEQQRIVEKVDSLMKVCDLLESKIGNAEEISKKLLESLLK